MRVKEGRLSAVTLHLVLSLAGGGLNDEPGGRVLGLVACRRSKSGDRVELWIGLERGELCGEVQLEAGKRLRGWCERELDRYEVGHSLLHERKVLIPSGGSPGHCGAVHAP